MVKVSELQVITTLDANDSLHVVDSGNSRQAAISTLSDKLLPLASTSSARRPLDERFGEIINVKDYGALGDGSTDDTASITAAWVAYQDATKLKAQLPGDAADADVLLSPTLYFPPGDYLFAGPALTSSQGFVRIMGAWRRAVRIRLTASVYFIDVSEFMFEVEITDLTVSGGKGLYRHSRTGENTTGYHSFKRLDLNGYTECAIGSLSSNCPKWNVEHCFFFGTSTSIGLLVPDQAAQCDIRHNSFDKNNYHLKVSCNNSLMQIGPNNTYLRTEAALVTADVWLVGRVTTTTNSGDGMVFFGERFSNEFMSVGDIRVLVAEEDTGSGSDLMDRTHATTDAGNFFVTGITFHHCGFSSTGTTLSANKGVVFSYLSRTQIDFIDNYVTGGWFPWWLEFDSGLTPNQGNVTNFSRVINSRSRFEGIQPRPCNVLGYVHHIPYDGGYWGNLDQADLQPGGDYNYEDVLTDPDPNTWFLSTGGGSAPTLSAQTDALGGTLATEITFLDGLGNLLENLTETNMVSGEQAWVEMDIKAAATVPLDQVRIDLRESAGGLIKTKTVEITTDWRRIRLPWTVNDNPTTIQIRLIATDLFVSSSKEKVVIGRPAVYRGNAPQHHRHLATAGSQAGEWDGPHLVLGATHLWVDTTGDLRIKSSAPTSDTDGTVVGTQT